MFLSISVRLGEDHLVIIWADNDDISLMFVQADLSLPVYFVSASARLTSSQSSPCPPSSSTSHLSITSPECIRADILSREDLYIGMLTKLPPPFIRFKKPTNSPTIASPDHQVCPALIKLNLTQLTIFKWITRRDTTAWTKGDTATEKILTVLSSSQYWDCGTVSQSGQQ